MTSRTFFVIGAISGFLSVALGAFAAHGLKSDLSPEMFAAFETGVRYQFYHTFALFVVGWALGVYGRKQFIFAGWCFVAGIVLFSGSLYALVVSGMSWIGAITPLGGVSLLLGWTAAGYGFWKTRTLT